MIQERKRNTALRYKRSSCQLQPLSSLRLALVWENTHTRTHTGLYPSPFSFSIFVSLANSILSSPSDGLNADNLISGCASSEGRDWNTPEVFPMQTNLSGVLIVRDFFSLSVKHTRTKTQALAHLPHLDLQEPPPHPVVMLYSSLEQ